jgi:hypothetical protein
MASSKEGSVCLSQYRNSAADEDVSSAFHRDVFSPGDQLPIPPPELDE